jgi:hypothetical protein
VRGRESLDDAESVLDHTPPRQRTSFELLAQSLRFKQFTDEERCTSSPLLAAKSNRESMARLGTSRGAFCGIQADSSRRIVGDRAPG